MTDVIDAVAGIAEGSPLAALRAQKPDLVRYTQGSHDVLLAPADPAGVTLAERALIALRIAVLDEHGELAAHYRARLRAVGGDEALVVAAQRGASAAPSPRLAAILGHVDRLTAAPGSATPAHLEALLGVGLGPRDIVTISQLISFVSYQVRLLAGLRLLAEEARA
ncbi:MAG: CMD domain protein [Proteobacteria bacterium]|nr:CMD domain protein [Pseudomonadota bacterium]